MELDKAVYDTGSFEVELSRYVTPTKVVDILVDNPSKITLEQSGGPRYASSLSATSENIVVVDIYPGPLLRQIEYIRNPQNYWDSEPIKTEVEELKKRGLDPVPDLSKFGFYLKGDSKPEFERFEVDNFRNCFDRCFAPELLLHSSDSHENLGIPIFQEVYDTLVKDGKFIFTVYPPSHAVKDTGCLDKYFEILTKTMKIKDMVIGGNWINIENLSLAINQQTFEKNKSFFDSFWIRDLSRIRLYTPEEIKYLSENRFRILEMQNIPGGMFPFATRHFYILEKI